MVVLHDSTTVKLRALVRPPHPGTERSESSVLGRLVNEYIPVLCMCIIIADIPIRC